MILLTLWILLVSILTLTFAAFLFYRWFHRVPVRTFPDDVTSVISPADGKVAVVKRFTSKKVKVEKWNAATVNLLAQDVAKKRVVYSHRDDSLQCSCSTRFLFLEL
jgi:hypothetical protein